MKNKIILLLGFILIAACSGGSGGGSSSSDDGDRTKLKPSSLIKPYDFGGNYEGTCVVKAMGVSSRSCKAVVNIYHELNGDTIGFMGIIDIDMGFTKVNYPVSNEPLNIEGDRLIVPDTGEDIGEINYQGFMIEQDNGDFMTFNRRDDGGFNFVGEYHDETYGKVNVEGTLQPKG